MRRIVKKIIFVGFLVTVLGIGGQFVMPQISFAQTAQLLTVDGLKKNIEVEVESFSLSYEAALKESNAFIPKLGNDRLSAQDQALKDGADRKLWLATQALGSLYTIESDLEEFGTNPTQDQLETINQRILTISKTNGAAIESTRVETRNKVSAAYDAELGRAPDTGHACFYWENTLPGINPIACFAEIANAGLGVTSYGVQLSGFIMDTSIDYSIYEISNFVNSREKGVDSPIQSAWKTIRDLANINFIFILLYLSIITILRADTNETKSILGKIIIAAILINFSLFFTNLIIDASNVTTLYFYNNAVSGTTTAKDKLGISTALMDQMLLPTVYNTKNQGIANGTTTALGTVKGTATGPALTWTGILIVGIFGSILFLITSFVFLAAGFLFLIRFVTLMFLIILSPIAFAAHILPGTKKYATQWWDKLFTQAIFAPAFMILLAISLNMVKGFSTQIEGQNFGTVLASAGLTQKSSGIFVNFIIIIFFLVGTILISSSLGAGGAKAVTSRGSKILRGARKWAGNKTKLAAGSTARGVIGGSARWADNKLANTSAGNSWVGRVARGMTTQKVAKAKWGTKKDAFQAKEDFDKMKTERRYKGAEIVQKKVEIARENLNKTYTADAGFQQAQNSRAGSVAAVKATRDSLKAEETKLASLQAQLSNRSLSPTQKQDLQQDIVVQQGVVASKRSSVNLAKRFATEDRTAVRSEQTRVREENKKVSKRFDKARQTRSDYINDKQRGTAAAGFGTLGATIGGMAAGPAGVIAGGITGSALGRLVKNRKLKRSWVRNALITGSADVQTEIGKILARGLSAEQIIAEGKNKKAQAANKKLADDLAKFNESGGAAPKPPASTP